MKIQALKIKGLFEMFTYDISFINEDNIRIITGTNGFGKTMILNIIFNLFNKRFSFFQKLVFEEIEVLLDNEMTVKILKKQDINKPKLTFFFYEKNKEIDKVEYSTKMDRELERNIERHLPMHKIDSDKWFDSANQRVMSIDEVLLEYGDLIFPETKKNNLINKNSEVNEILSSIHVHLIKEQRLFKKVLLSERDYRLRQDREQTIMMETINTYAKELKKIISDNIQKSFTQTQALDSTYLDRLIDEKNKISENDYKLRLLSLNEKQEKLIEFGLYESKQKVRDYSQEDAKALLIYIHDLEQKLRVFDELLDKLELFTDILNDRRFTFKTINISREKGFLFKTSAGKELELDQLSSGEQHEVILLYELIFNVKANTVVLIDEPEISLHVAWQKEFLSDLKKIVKLHNTQVIIATHSPAIINGLWDLVYTLKKEEEIHGAE